MLLTWFYYVAAPVYGYACVNYSCSMERGSRVARISVNHCQINPLADGVSIRTYWLEGLLF